MPYFHLDELDNEIIKEGLRDCLDYIKFGQIQQCFLNMFMKKLANDKLTRKYQKQFFLLNKDSSGEIKAEELLECYKEQGFKHVGKDIVS